MAAAVMTLHGVEGLRAMNQSADMKAFFATLGICASLVVSCAKPPPSGSTAVAGPPNSPYREWTTAQLQQRRSDLYYMLPQRPNAAQGAQLPQQEEIRAIEGELIRRFRAGDKTAELKPVWPAPSPQAR
jgi:hypothetical protein